MSLFTPDRTILVTGASSGIGRAIALKLNAEGATVIASGRDRAKLESGRAEAARPEAFHLEARDMTDEMEQLPDWIKTLREKYGKLTGLAPCAGYAIVQPLRQYTREEGAKAFDILYHAPMLLARGFADRRNNIGAGASILFLSSASAIAREAGLSIYGAAKAAVMAGTGILSKELAGQKIRVNAIAPGVVRTPMGEQYLSLISEEAKARELAAYPFGLGEAKDVAAMAVFLLSDKCGWVTGQTIVMDGGRY